MDIARPELKRKRRLLRIIYSAAGLVIVALVTLGLSRLKAAAPSVDKTTVWTDTVKRGPMLREVHGLGTLVPETIRVIPAATDGRVEQRLLLPGTPVNAKTVILELSNSELQQSVLDAGFPVEGRRSGIQQPESARKSAYGAAIEGRRRALRVSPGPIYDEAYDPLYKEGVLAELIWKTSQVKAEELAKQNEIAEKQVETFAQSIEGAGRGAAGARSTSSARSINSRSQLDALHVRAGISGVLQLVPVDVGQHITPGTNLARVADPKKLKAEIKIAETQAKDVAIGQKATVDTQNGIVGGHVSRIDPSVVNGTVTVDVSIDDPLPLGARPDLSVDGTISWRV